jgi:hypothetical protein
VVLETALVVHVVAHLVVALIALLGHLPFLEVVIVTALVVSILQYLEDARTKIVHAPIHLS